MRQRRSFDPRTPTFPGPVPRARAQRRQSIFRCSTITGCWRTPEPLPQAPPVEPPSPFRRRREGPERSERPVTFSKALRVSTSGPALPGALERAEKKTVGNFIISTRVPRPLHDNLGLPVHGPIVPANAGRRGLGTTARAPTDVASGANRYPPRASDPPRPGPCDWVPCEGGVRRGTRPRAPRGPTQAGDHRGASAEAQGNQQDDP